MKTKEWTTVDKSLWGEGPWACEPDKVQWTGPKGFACLAVRGSVGAWCGYVGVPRGHWAYGLDYGDDRVQRTLTVHGGSPHGGLTFSNKCQPAAKGQEHESICHLVEPGEPDDVWWLGFDCAHSGDLLPKLLVWLGKSSRLDTYWPLEYVKAQVQKLENGLANGEVLP
jgi:hypothetical protein